MKVYVVTEPASIRGIYPTWPECKAAVAGVRGARFQAVESRERAEAILRGEAVVLAPGLWAFVDGNHLGGIGVVLVEQPPTGEARVLREDATTVYAVYADAGIAALGSRASITAALERLRNVLAELGALLAALGLVARGATVTIVHDYEGVGAWMEGRWKVKDPLVTDIVAACRARAAARRLTLAFRRQRGHASTWAGRDDFAAYNARADALATRAAETGW
jgi:ribonuclease HI